MANIDDKKIPVGTTETPIVGRLHDVSEDHVVTGANEVFDDAFGERQSQINDKLRHYTKMAHIRIDAEEITREHNDNLLNEQINAKQLEIGAIETDIEPILESPNMLPSGAIAFNLGWYRGNDNPEWVYCITDGAMRILAGIKKDGSVEWMIGVPTPVKNYVEMKVKECSPEGYEDIVNFLNGIQFGDKKLQELLDEKVDKVEGKSLINEEFANGIHYEESPEFVEVKLDEEDKILEAINKDGTKLLPVGYNVDGVIVKTLSNPEFLAVWLDNANHILFALETDGNIIFAAGVPKQIIEYVKEIIKPFEELFHFEENPEFIDVKLDAEDKVIEGVKTNGNKYFATPVENDAQVKSVISNPEYLKVTTDAEDKIINSIDKELEDIRYGGINLSEMKRDADCEVLEVGIDADNDEVYTIENNDSTITLEIDEDWNVYEVKDSKHTAELIMADEGIYLEQTIKEI